jgi:phosphinothricin acetyltransferase
MGEGSGEVRDATLADAPRLREIYAYYVQKTAITFEWEVPSLEEFEGRMIATMRRYPYLVIERDGIVEGYAYAGVFIGRAAYDWSCEMTIYLDYRTRHKGMGHVLYEALESRLKAMGVLNLYACIGYPEIEDEHLTLDSAKFHKRLGYRFVGRFYKCGYKFGRWYDMVWMEKLIGEHVDDPRPVVDCV